MAIYLVRHAKAGSRSRWEGPDDRLRPLSAPGNVQAKALAERLAPLASVLLSSPYVRCRQTLLPLAERLGLEVAEHGALAEAEPFEPVIDLIGTLPDGAVLCSHGDVVPETVMALARRGAEFVGQPDWRKASVWVLERNVDGFIASMTVWAPPAP